MASADVTMLDRDANPLEAVPDRSWSRIEKDLTDCQDCGLAEHRTKVVPGSGNPDADLLVIGAGPTRHEDLQGKSFVGGAGNLLNTCLLDAGFERDDVFVTHILKCRPPERQAPTREQLEACSRHLRDQIAHIQPRVIVTLGEFATSFLLHRRLPIDKIAGTRLDVFDGVTLVPTHDPVAAIRGKTRAAGEIKQHLRVARAVLEGDLATGAEVIASLKRPDRT